MSFEVRASDEDRYRVLHDACGVPEGFECLVCGEESSGAIDDVDHPEWCWNPDGSSR